MPRDVDAPPRFIEGDLVRDRRGNTGSARLCRRRDTGEQFIGLKITAGPDKGEWGKSYHFEPVLDHEGGSLRAICERCERPFLATVRTERVGALQTKDYPKQEKCRTCTGHTRTAAQRDRDRQLDETSVHQQRTGHHAVPGRDL
jgi:hypothetical protein